MTAPGDPAFRSREFLFDRIHDGIRYALLKFGGFNPGGSFRDRDAWRHAPLEEVLAAVMTHLRAGLGPAMDNEAVEASVRWLRQHVPNDVLERIRDQAREQAPPKPGPSAP